MEYELTADSLERRQKAAQIMERLRYIPKSESAIFENAHNDSDSELDDPFSDDDDQITLARKKKRMSKIETDLYLMSSFSESHKRAAEIARRPEPKSNTNADTPTIEQPLQVQEDQEFLDETQRLLAQCGLDVYLRKKEQEQMESDAKNKAKPDGGRQQVRRPVATVNVDANETNSMSGIWHMLDGQSVDNGFPITEMGYNVYEDKRLEWLTREDLTYGEREAVKIKCEKWMKKCYL